MLHRVLLRVAFAAIAVVWSAAALAQGQTIRIIYPFAPGGGGDAVLRILVDKMQESLNQTVVVENRTGASGRIGVKR